jgi:hypothetical protein
MALTDLSNMGLERFAYYLNATNQNIERADQPDSTGRHATYTLVYSHRPESLTKERLRRRVAV